VMISRAQISQIVKVYKSQSQNHIVLKPESDAGTTKLDGVDLSFSQVDVERVKEIACALPEIREDKVLELRQKIESGTYDVAPDEIADKILGRLIADSIK
jgi:negative regulator of flagellin synthesis FlgM